jgi:hypothetical protein
VLRLNRAIMRAPVFVLSNRLVVALFVVRSYFDVPAYWEENYFLLCLYNSRTPTEKADHGHGARVSRDAHRDAKNAHTYCVPRRNQFRIAPLVAPE